MKKIKDTTEHTCHACHRKGYKKFRSLANNCELIYVCKFHVKILKDMNANVKYED